MEEKKEKKIDGFDDNNYDQQFKKAIEHGRKNLKIYGKIKVPDFLMEEKNNRIINK